MKALLTRLANMKTDLNIWFEQLSNWQFVAAAAAVALCVVVVIDCVVALATGHANLSFNIFYDVVFTATFTAFLAWKRWKLEWPASAGILTTKADHNATGKRPTSDDERSSL